MRIKFFNEGKKDNWIKDAIRKKDALRKSLGKKKGEKISSEEIDSEIKKIKSKDKDKNKKGVQGLSKSDLKKYRRLNLAKTLMNMKESNDYKNDNYMFFANLKHIIRMASEISEMDDSKIDEMLTNGHDWANDHISKSMESIEHVYNFLVSSLNGENPENGDVKSFDDFK